MSSLPALSLRSCEAPPAMRARLTSVGCPLRGRASPRHLGAAVCHLITHQSPLWLPLCSQKISYPSSLRLRSLGGPWIRNMTAKEPSGVGGLQVGLICLLPVPDLTRRSQQIKIIAKTPPVPEPVLSAGAIPGSCRGQAPREGGSQARGQRGPTSGGSGFREGGLSPGAGPFTPRKLCSGFVASEAQRTRDKNIPDHPG